MWSSRDVDTCLEAVIIGEITLHKTWLFIVKLKMDIPSILEFHSELANRDKLSLIYIMDQAQNVFSKLVCKK